MAHYAFLDKNNIVIEIIVGKDENEEVDGISDWESYYGEIRNMMCKRTSYNTINGKKRNPETGEMTEEPGFRGNYAGIGYFYDVDLDAFIPPKPFPSWILNESVFNWEAPVAYPTDGKLYTWNEELGNWEEVILPAE